MQHIGEKLAKPNLGDFVDQLRKRLPKLAGVEDMQIRAQMLDLWDAADCREKCFGCNDYAGCWREGDARGRVPFVTVADGRVQIERRKCDPYRVHEAREVQTQMLRDSGMSEKERKFTFDNFPEEQRRRHRRIYERAKQFAETFEEGAEMTGLYLHGPTGIAKTHLMLAVLNRLNDRGIPALFVRADKIIDQMREAIAKGGDPDAVLRRYQTAPVLGIDEFAQERKTDWSLERMQKLIDFRQMNDLSTWYTSNYGPTDVYQAHYHGDDIERIDAIRSRVYLSTAARMDGVDHRMMNLVDALGPEEDDTDE